MSQCFVGTIAPTASGMVSQSNAYSDDKRYGHDRNDPNMFRYVAYQHPHGETYFSGFLRGATGVMEQGPYAGIPTHTNILSTHNGRKIPQEAGSTGNSSHQAVG